MTPSSGRRDNLARAQMRQADMQRAVLNILDDFDTEKTNLEKTQSATFNILEDFNSEKERLEDSQRAVLNILDDFDTEKTNLEKTQSATFNILEDFNLEKLRLEDTQRALLNIMDDFNRSNEELQEAHGVLEARVEERTAALRRSNESLTTEMKEREMAEETLRRRTDELTRSNAELEQFAYIASHDLQEPLRMISSYVQLLGRRYAGKLDQDADDFIGYAHEGAVRMQKMINDLLAYSRVGTRGASFEVVGLEKALNQALDNLQVILRESNAVVTNDRLPAVRGDTGQLTQVFQNLIDNAVKFRSEEQPRVHVSAVPAGDYITISVQDNGIGIDPEYVERIFLLFQRLHTRTEYPGTGIGLAICKRIVERHRGRIWVESKPQEGSTFFFTLPTPLEPEVSIG